ncbi:conjugative relaxase [Phragmitibacter flavus]|uniref:Conjugative relaxase n=1 Tax=Phragmitibacter flavus TaxID=2576071 RepID=A0A5R8KIA0_9BACT|nr:MobF family relaxase [Phragmitibacter flavus]TLD71349.1 conjugative relaxase [Phragmitibacter flavus]
MLSPKTQYNLKNAKAYFEEHLCVGDYYSENQAVAGEWVGEGARSLGLSGVVHAQAFLALCENLDPRTGEKLTARRKNMRRVIHSDGSKSNVANRRVFFDFTISPPKSVSIVALISGDERVLESHDRAVRLAMQELEHFASTRVRLNEESSDRTTGNIVAAVFRHETSRALDPHLHSHCVVFNATFDAVEERWKALQNYEMLLARKYVENVYYHELGRDLRRFGYAIKNKARGDFEIEGVPESLLQTFGKRRREIDDQTRELLSKLPELTTRNLGEVREHIAHNKRAWKTHDVSSNMLREWWANQVGNQERDALSRLTKSASDDVAMDETAALRWAEDHLFDRKSLVREHELWSYALERGRGESFTLEQLQDATRKADYLRDKKNPKRLTTRPVLQREWDIVCISREEVNSHAPFVSSWNGHAALDAAQQRAARRILGSRDLVTLFRGGAGTGKSFTLRTVFDALREHGRVVQVLAPQRQQVQDLAQDGMIGSQTVSEFLTRQDMAKGTVVVIDEAGQIGAKQMLDLMTLVQRHRGRLILSGDTRQHGAVQASDALWAIEKFGRLRVAELNEIRRQDPALAHDEAERKWITEYKQAVKEAAEGKISRSFERLEDAGMIVECTLANQQERLAQDYLELTRAGQSALIVSPTWGEIHRVNDQVRCTLQAEGRIGRDEWNITALTADDLTDSQKRDARYYTEDSVVVVNQTVAGLSKGTAGKLVAMTRTGVVIEAAGRIRTIPHGKVGHLTVCKGRELALCKGDKIQLKANAMAVAGERVSNGELVGVKSVENNGSIHLEDGRVLPAAYRQLGRGYAVTSYASQGKTVDHVLFSDSSVKAAINDQQWYVTISRGRKGVRIFTTDKKALHQNVVRCGRRELALDIAPYLTLAALPDAIHPLPRKRDFLSWCINLGKRVRLLTSLLASQRQTPQVKLQTSLHD